MTLRAGAGNAAAAASEASRAAPSSRIARAVITMLFAGLLSSMLHIGVRHVSPHVPTFEIVFLRAIFTILFTLPFMAWAGQISWRTNSPRLQIFRGVVGVVSMSSWYYALGQMPLADAGALSFTTGIFVTIGAAAYFGEPVGLRRWTAVIVGLIGAFIVLKPGRGVISWPALLAAGSSVLWAVSLLIAKELGKLDSTLTITFYQPLTIAPVAGLLALPAWVTPPASIVLILAAMGLVAAMGNYAYIKALHMADASITMPADYVRLIWMASWGYFLYGEVPDLATWIGAGLIIGSTFVITVREQQLARARARAAANRSAATPGGSSPCHHQTPPSCFPASEAGSRSKARRPTSKASIG